MTLNELLKAYCPNKECEGVQTFKYIGQEEGIDVYQCQNKKCNQAYLLKTINKYNEVKRNGDNNR